ncbi:MAG: TlpA family protein disulfide reductase [Fusobacteriaceae bacterium]|jgi:thiol-disulfide isomerase/thioredoxin|nr:TlpA family protein disulfide reductase [Fusobacteriaceae bacterium]
MNHLKAKIVIFLGLLALSAQLFCAGEKFPEFTAKTLDGGTFTRADFAKHKVTLLNVWGTFCPPCLEEMPHLGEISREYADRDFAVVGLVIDTLKENGDLDEAQVQKAREIVGKTKADYTHMLPATELFPWLGNIQFIPDTVFVDSEGKVIGKHLIGSASKADWKAKIEEVLQAVK